MLSVPFSQQEATRRTEAEINLMFDTWRARFPEKSDRELLAMIAFRYADRHASLMKEREDAFKQLGVIGSRLGELVGGAQAETV